MSALVLSLKMMEDCHSTLFVPFNISESLNMALVADLAVDSRKIQMYYLRVRVHKNWQKNMFAQSHLKELERVLHT